MKRVSRNQSLHLKQNSGWCSCAGAFFGNTTLQICWLVIFQGHGEDRAGRYSFVRCVFFQNLLFNNCFSAMSNVHALVPAATFCTVSDPICSILWFCISWFIITLNALYLLGLLKCHSALCSRTTHFGNLVFLRHCIFLWLQKTQSYVSFTPFILLKAGEDCLSPLLLNACVLLPEGLNSAVREEQLLMERAGTQTHLEAFSADTPDISSPQQTATVLQKRRQILQETSSLPKQWEEMCMNVFWFEPLHQWQLVSKVRKCLEYK